MNRVDAILARFPHFYRSGDAATVLQKFLKVFAQELDLAEEALLRVMYAHWVTTADNTPSKGNSKGDLDRILALYLESLGGTSLIKQGFRRSDPAEGAEDDTLYRNRAMSIINVLRNGAVTRQGILDIVAANLGVADDMPYQAVAKSQIQIIEYLPSLVVSGQDQRNKQNIQLFTPFEIHCQSDVDTYPEFYLTFGTADSQQTLPSLFNIRLLNMDTGDSVLFEGEVKAGDVLVFLAETGAILRHKHYPTKGKVTLAYGVNRFYMEADYGKNQTNFIPYPFAQFDANVSLGEALFAVDNNSNNTTHYPDAQFDQSYAFDEMRFASDANISSSLPIARFDNESPVGKVVFGAAGRFEPTNKFVAHQFARFERGVPIQDAIFANDLKVAQVDVSYQKLTCGTFKVVVPWDLAGFTASIWIDEPTLSRLKRLGVPSKVLNTYSAMKGSYQTLEDYYKSFNKLTTSWLETERDRWGAYLLQEATLKDKYADFQVNPRGQLSAIVQRVKAAGVYAEVAFEKKFTEPHHLADAFEFSAHQTIWNETQALEDNFMVNNAGQLVEKQDTIDSFSLAAVFDHTCFDSLNGFG